MKNYIPMPRLFFILCCVFFTASLHAQVWKWGKSNSSTYHGAVESYPICTDRSGNVIAAGIAFGEDSTLIIGSDTIRLWSIFNYAILATKIDSFGNILWTRASRIGDAEIACITTDDSNNIYFSGQYFSDTLAIDTVIAIKPAVYYTMGYIAKLSPDGRVLWIRNTIPATKRYARECICLDGGNNIYVAGSFSLPTVTAGTIMLHNATATGDSIDIYVIKYSPTGNIMWAKSFGGDGDDGIWGISVARNGDLFLGGEFSSTSMIVGADTLVDSLTGFAGIHPPYSSFVAKFDNNGPIWAKSLHKKLVLGAICTDTKNNLYVTGVAGMNCLDGGDSLFAGGSFIEKRNNSGNIIWANSGKADGWGAWGSSIATDTCGNSWICGGVDASLSFEGHIIDSPAISFDKIFVAAFDECGHYIPGSGSELPSGSDDALQMALDNRGHLYFGGDYTIPIIIGSDTLASPGLSEYLLVARYDCGEMPCSNCDSVPVQPQSVNETTLRDKFDIYPNPATATLNITGTTIVGTITISNALGQAVYTDNCTTNKASINIMNLPPGIYSIRINNYVVRKFIKE